MSRFVVTVIINKCRGRQHYRYLVTDSGRLCVRKLWREVTSRQSCLSVATLVPLMHRPESGCGSAWSFLAVKRQASIAALYIGKSAGILNKYWFNWELFFFFVRCPHANLSEMLYKKSCSKRSKFASQKCYSQCHNIGIFFRFTFKSSKFDSAGELTALHIMSRHLTWSCPLLCANWITWLQMIFVLIRPPVSFDPSIKAVSITVLAFFSRSLISWSWLVAAAVSLLFSCVVLEVYFGVCCSSQPVFS